MKTEARSCDDLGVCQGRTPSCSCCSASHHQHDQVNSPWDWIERVAFAALLAIVAMCAAALVATASNFWR